MPSNIFVNTYQLYQEHINKLAKWLLETAKQCGWGADSYEDMLNNHAGQRSRRSKKKKSQPRLPPAAAAAAAAAEGLTFRVHLSDFVELATVIAESKHITVPDAVIKLVQETVEIRNRFSEFYDKQASYANEVVDSPAHSRHLIVIQTLKKLLEILQRDRGSKESMKSAEDSTPVDTVEEAKADHSTVTDILETLEITAATRPAFEAPEADKSEPKETPKPDCKIVYEADAATDEDICFAVFCIIDDYRQIRIHLQKTWWNYKLGKMDLVDASVITNTAFDLVRRADEEFCCAFPIFQNSCQISDAFYAYFCAVRCADPGYFELPDDWFNYKMAEIAQLCYMPTEYLLDSFCSVLQPDTVPQLVKGAFGFYNPKVPRNRLSFREKLAEDKVIILEILPEFCLLAQSQVHYLGEDELTRGLGDMYRTKKPTLWLCFAMQVFLDIHHCLRDQIGNAHGELQAAGYAAKHLLDKTHPTNIWFRSTLFYIQEWIIGDILDTMRRRFYKSAYGQGDVEPYFLMSQHPLLCGLTKFSIMLLMRETGIAESTTCGSILSVVYLYSALRQMEMLKAQWPAIEAFLFINTPETLFMEGLPTTLEDSVKKYELMMGVAPDFFTKDNRARKEETNRGEKNFWSYTPSGPSGPCDWAHDSPIIKIFWKRYVVNGSVDWTVENIEALVSENSNADLGQQATQLRWKKSHQLSTLQLLSCLQDAMTAESVELTYDYLGMHHECMHVLDALKGRLHEKFVEYYGLEDLTWEDQLPHIVGCILTISMEEQNVAQSKSDARGEIRKSQMLSVAADVLEKAIKKENDQHEGDLHERDHDEEEAPGGPS